MKRIEAVETMVDFYESIPEGASSYHKMDMLLSRLERIGMLPPENGLITYDIYNNVRYCRKWESENEEE